MDWRALWRSVDWLITQLHAHLVQLLFDLRRRSLDIRPVEPHTRSPVLQPMGAMQRRQVRWQPLLDRRALARLHLLPRLPVTALVQMRMSAPHLRDEATGHITDIERAALFCHNGV